MNLVFFIFWGWIVSLHDTWVFKIPSSFCYIYAVPEHLLFVGHVTCCAGTFWTMMWDKILSQMYFSSMHCSHWLCYFFVLIICAVFVNWLICIIHQNIVIKLASFVILEKLYGEEEKFSGFYGCVHWWRSRWKDDLWGILVSETSDSVIILLSLQFCGY